MEKTKDKVIKSLVAVFFVVGSILSLGVKFVADDAVLSVDRPVFARVTPDNNVSVLIGDTIYFIDADGLAAKNYDLEEKGFNIRGDYDFFSNGDILFYSNNEEVGILENLSQFLRMKETRRNAASGTDGLYRCSNWMTDCRLFTNELPALHKTFGLFIDRKSDTVYLSDTTRFALYKLDKEGRLLAENDDDLYFPNQIHLHEKQLFIADTNHHSIKVVRSETESFGEKIESHKVAIGGRYSWPTEIIKTPGNWWLGIADHAMKNGGIQIYDDDWEKVGTALLKNTEAASRALVLFGDEVWVTDWANLKIYRFDLSGKRLEDFTNHEVDQVFADSGKLIKQHEATSFTALLAFFVVFIAGIIAAFKLEKEETIKLFDQEEDYFDDATVDLKSPPGDGVYWMEPPMNKHRKIITVVFALALFYLMWEMAGVLSSVEGAGLMIPYLMVSMTPIFLIIFWAWYRLTKTKIGILGEYLLADDGRGNVGKGKGPAIKYSRNILVVDNVVILLGQPYRPFFPKDELKKWVMPRMLLGESVSQWQVMKLLWSQKHPSVIAFMVIFIYFTLMLVAGAYYTTPM